KKLCLTGLAMTLCSGFAAITSAQQAPGVQQPPSGPPTAQVAAPQSGSVDAAGAVRSFTYAPLGEVDGFVLDNGTIVHYPPHLGPQVGAMIALGNQVRVSGWMTTGPMGDPRLEAQTITNITTNTALNVAAVLPPGPGIAPPPIGTGGPPPPPP